MSIFGNAFHRGGVWVAVIAAGCALNAFVGLGETILMVEHPKINLINSMVAFAAAVGLNLALIPAFGALGAALGILGPYLIKGVLRRIEIAWLLGWHWPWRALIKPWVATLVALPLALIIRLWTHSLGFELAAAGFFVIGYLITWRIIGLDRSDRAVLDQLFKRKNGIAATVAETPS
jgi:O-antigen/teichoic acid export membrane protein